MIRLSIWWRGCNMTGKIVSMLLHEVKCVMCIRYQDRLHGVRNYNPAFITGSIQIFGHLPFKNHARSDMHQWAVQRRYRVRSNCKGTYLTWRYFRTEAQWDASGAIQLWWKDKQLRQVSDTRAPPKPTTSQSEDDTATSEPYHLSLEDWETFIAWATLCTPLSVWICALLFDCIILLNLILCLVNSWECLINCDYVHTLGQNNFLMMLGALVLADASSIFFYMTQWIILLLKFLPGNSDLVAVEIITCKVR